MKPVFDFQIFIPVFFILMCTFIVLFFCNWYLKKTKIISYPIGGLEWNRVTNAASIFTSSLLILSSITEPVFQSYKVYISQRQSFGSFLYISSGRFIEIFLVSVIAIIFYFAIVRVSQIVIRDKQKGDSGVDTDNLPFAIVMASLSIGIAIVIKSITVEVIQTIVPFIINYSN